MINNELYHHGVKGMKWGVRRYQNKDGSRTSAGKKRYGGNAKTNNTKSASKSKKSSTISKSADHKARITKGKKVYESWARVTSTEATRKGHATNNEKLVNNLLKRLGLDVEPLKRTQTLEKIVTNRVAKEESYGKI